MEVHFTPGTEKKLQDLAAQSGRGSADELVQDVVERYFDELAQTRDMLSELALCVRPCRLSYRQLPARPAGRHASGYGSSYSLSLLIQMFR